ncbi:MAG: type I glyceraldehyde-3-phosphate dehydrogenase [Cryomorphaceae bacterium]|nr:MAG: type I glyceraldehyde-3-phosphate dehydrogenase [Cryomorphaceae bacterium]
MTRIGINGLGRIGRRLFRLLSECHDMEVVAVNDLADAETMNHLLRFDSVHGLWNLQPEVAGNALELEGRSIAYSRHAKPVDIPWFKHEVDIVFECTGHFKTRERANGHLQQGVRAVVLSAPPEDATIKTIVMGINDHLLSADDRIVSNASCTTNSAAPMVQLVDEICGVKSGYITTVHSYTTDQRLQDAPHRDLRRARAAAHSIVPTTTGAAKAITRIFPHLDGKLGGCGIRVPVPNGSLTDISYVVERPPSVEVLNEAFASASLHRWNGLLQYIEDPVVSADIIGNRHSCIFDAQLTSVIDHMVKVVGWYDNETGYSARLIDLARKMIALQNA